MKARLIVVLLAIAIFCVCAVIVPSYALSKCGDCDDKNPCTKDYCGPNGCVHEPIDCDIEITSPPEVTGPGITSPPEVTSPGITSPPDITSPGIANPPEVTSPSIANPPEVTSPGITNPPEVTSPGKIGRASCRERV